MDFGLSEEQEMLKKMARDFLTAECPKSLVREMTNDTTGYTPELWRKMAELGWMGLAFPEKYGGSGGTFLDLVVLMEEMGRACLPGPFFTTVVVGGMTILAAGSEAQKQELLPKIADGSLIVTLALSEPQAGYSVDGVTMKAVADGDGYLLSGTKFFVPDAHVANYLICVAKTKKGITLFLVDSKAPGLTYTALKTMVGDKQYEVVFSKVKVSKANVLGGEGKGDVYLNDVLLRAAVVKCAEMVGGGQQVLEMTVNHVKERKQFGVPVGSFQAVQHHCANICTDVETSRFITHEAAWRIAEGLPYNKEAAMAKAWVTEAYKRIAFLGHQCIGGVGLIEDHDMPLYVKRAKAAELSFGDADYHRELTAQAIGL